MVQNRKHVSFHKDFNIDSVKNNLVIKPGTDYSRNVESALYTTDKNSYNEFV